MVIRDFANSLHNLKIMLTYHSFSELFLRPWSYTAPPRGEETLHQLVLRSINAISAIHGHTSSEDIWYTSSGEATDWFGASIEFPASRLSCALRRAVWTDSRPRLPRSFPPPKRTCRP